MHKVITFFLTISVIFSMLSGCSFENSKDTTTIIETEVTEISTSTEATAYNENDIGEIYCAPIDDEHIAEYDNGIMYADNEILLVAEDDTSYETIENLAKEYDAEIVGWIEQTGDYQLKFNNTYTKDKIDTIACEIENNSYIELAYPNYISEFSADSINYGSAYTDKTWDEMDISGDNWNLEAINCLSAWELFEKNTTEDEAIKIGLIDYGFDDTHEDLGFAETFYNSSFLSYYIYLSDNGKNNAAHGTHVAGIMAAKSNNHEGICGVYPYGDNNLYGVAMCGINGVYSYEENLTSHIYYKIALAELILRNVKVINISWGVDANLITLNNVQEDYKKISNIMSDFLNKFLDKGYDFVIVTSAGNDSNQYYAKLNIDNPESPIYDSNGTYYEVVYKENSWCYNNNKVNGLSTKEDSNVKYIKQADATYGNPLCSIDKKELKDRIIVVGAVNSKLKLTSYSNGGERVDVFAPGGDDSGGVYSTFPMNNYYGYKNPYKGTSMASPHIAGIAAMVWTVNSSLNGAEVKNIICKSGELDSENAFDNFLKKTTGAKSVTYIEGNDATLVDAYRAIKLALGEETTDTQSNTAENGGILSWVVDINDNDIFISDAKIIATNVATGEIESETTTDSDGHFELILPEGTYILTVTAIDYKEYTSTEIEVKNEGINYLDDWIKLTPENSLIENVINNESIWITNLEKENNSLYNASGDDYIWFQDMDMDGILEFIVMSKYQKDLDLGHDYRYFTVYECDNENFEYYPQANCDLVSTATFSIDKGDLKSDTFNYSLWQKSDGSYIYLTTDSVDIMLGRLEYLKLEKGGSVNFPIIEIWDEDYPYKGCNINWTSFGSDDFSDNVSYSDAIQYYNNYFSDLIPYNTVTKMIKVSDYKNKTNSEKEELLKSSYDAWDYSKSNSMELPLKEVIDYISNQVELEKQVDYKEVYKSVIEKLSGYSNKTSINYTLFDMNDDNIPELITISGTCEADYILTFYSIIKSAIHHNM